MNFFEHQDTARRNTRRLVILMLLAVVSLMAITTALVAVVLYVFQYGGNGVQQAYTPTGNVVQLAFHTLSWEILGYIVLAVGAVVALGSAYKLLQLSGGGRTVAEAMGGRLINLDTRDADERKILNVVEEMAIASGTPVPPVYLIDDESINAFAAGFQPQDAVIGITRGSIRLLSRDELQGVVAHEFSHILHGDMRLNIRLVGILHGILVIGLIGYFLLRSAHVGAYSSSRRRGSNAVPMLALGVGLIVIGYAGTFFGNLIKAAVSRQREFLADASAVQFTRNPEGISGALKKIGGYAQGSLLRAPSAAEFSHMYFGQGVKTHFLTGLMATHPPLTERIARVDPSWNGQFPVVEGAFSGGGGAFSQGGGAFSRGERALSGGEERAFSQGEGRTLSEGGERAFSRGEERAFSRGGEKPVGAELNRPAGKFDQLAGFTQAAVLASGIESVGQPTPDHVNYAQQLLQTIPDALKQNAHDPFSARAIIYSLLLTRSSEPVAAKQWQQLRQQAHPMVFKLTAETAGTVGRLDTSRYLPLLELCIPALKSLSPSQHQVFKRNLIGLIRADDKVDLFEWSLYRIVMHNLEPGSKRAENVPLKRLSDECQLVLSMVAHSGHEEISRAQAAFEQGFSQLDIGSRFFMGFFMTESGIQLPDLDRAVERLKQLKPLQKPLLLKALATCISHDAQVTTTEAELFRAIADSLDCPVPPFLSGDGRRQTADDR